VPREERDSGLTIFLTGNELSSLRPCGCSGGQLGGLEKRPAVFHRVPASDRLIVDTGTFLARDSEQDLIKLRIILRALDLLDYDVVRLTDFDVEMMERLGFVGDWQQAFDIITDRAEESLPRTFVKRFPDRGLTVRVASFDPRTSGVEQVIRLFAGDEATSTVDILMLRQCDEGILREIAAKIPGIDCIICPPESDEPHILSGPDARPLVVTVGRFGRYVCRLRVATAGPSAEPALHFDVIPVTAELPDDQALVQLYQQYQQLVKESNLLESYPRLPLPEGLAYEGSESCKKCHEYEYEQWSAKPHAEAFATLTKVGADADPECVICHVVGMEYESGFVTEAKTPHLGGVGCENCHGPGSEHNRSYGLKPTRQPQMSCVTCHTPEKSTGFAGHEEEYMEKIIHWREPTAAGEVKD